MRRRPRWSSEPMRLSTATPAPARLRELKHDELTSRAISKAADAGDELAHRLMRETAHYLAVGAVSLMHTIDPDIVLFGGGMIAAGQPFLEHIRADIRERGLSRAGGEDADRVCPARR